MASGCGLQLGGRAASLGIMRVLIIGCGYVGLPLGVELVAQGHEVFGLRRSCDSDASLSTAGITPLTGDITRPEDLAALPGPFDWVVNLVSSSRGGPDIYRQVYLEGTRNVLAWLKDSPPAKFIYTSSTSVYGQTDGSVVKEEAPTEPPTETGKILVETEKLLLDAFAKDKFPAIILRAAGIYGPDRGHLFLKYLADEATMADNGRRLINMIHVDDLVGIIIRALQSGRAGEIFNAVDDEPIAQIHFFRFLSETLGKRMPPPAAPGADADRKRGLTQKKVSNRKVKMELGYEFKHPNFRKGYTAEIIKLQRAGVLEYGMG